MAVVIEPKVTCALFWDLEKFYIEEKKANLELDSPIISRIALPLKLRCPTLMIVEIMYFNSIQLCEIVLSPAYSYC